MECDRGFQYVVALCLVFVQDGRGAFAELPLECVHGGGKGVSHCAKGVLRVWIYANVATVALSVLKNVREHLPVECGAPHVHRVRA